MYQNIHSSFIQVRQNLEIPQISNHKRLENKLWFIHTTQLSRGMNPDYRQQHGGIKNFMLSERSLTEKSVSCMFSYMGNARTAQVNLKWKQYLKGLGQECWRTALTQKCSWASVVSRPGNCQLRGPVSPSLKYPSPS